MIRHTMRWAVLGAIVGGSAWAAGGDGGAPLISRALVQAAGLEWRWQVQLPVRQAEHVDYVFVSGQTVYALTDWNVLIAVDRQTGQSRFILEPAPKGLPVSGPLFYAEKLWFMVGSELVCVDPAERQVVSRTRLKGLGGGIAGPIARNEQYLYVPGADAKLHVFWVDGYIEAFAVRPDDGSVVRSVSVDEETAVFASAGGHVIAIAAGENRKLWQFDVLGPITAPIVRDGDWLYVCGQDAKVYRLEWKTGQNTWSGREFYAGAPLDTAPVMGAQLFYQFAGLQGVHAVRKDSGQKVWTVPAGQAVLAEAEGRAYVFQQPGRLVAVDNGTGHNVWTMNAAGVTRYAGTVGQSTPLIVLADDTGRLLCIGIGPAK